MIKIKIKDPQCFLFIPKCFLDKIKDQAGGLEKGGYLFVKRIKGTNEFVLDHITLPNSKDSVSSGFMSLSKSHMRLARKIQRKNRFLQQIGFYHTHPESFGCYMSNYDADEFSKKSLGHMLTFYIIAIIDKVSIYIYSEGKVVKRCENV